MSSLFPFTKFHGSKTAAIQLCKDNPGIVLSWQSDSDVDGMVFDNNKAAMLYTYYVGDVLENVDLIRYGDERDEWYYNPNLTAEYRKHDPFVYTSSNDALVNGFYEAALPLKAPSTKLPLALIPPEWEILLADLAGQGAKKYGARDWEQRTDFSYMDRYESARRHMAAFLLKKDFDDETGAHQMIAAAFNCLMIATHAIRKTGKDDRPDCASKYLSAILGVKHDDE